MTYISAIGATAAVLTVFNMLPQYIQVMRTKHTKDLSRLTFIIITCSVALWVIYGILKHDPVIYGANAPVLFFSASILFFKLKNG
jgi:MtN3 and saliva related transmembrane protein